MTRAPLLMMLFGCTDSTDTFLVYTLEGDHHVVAPVAIPTLEDPVRLIGQEGRGYAGGSFSFAADDNNPYASTAAYRPGPPVRLGLDVVDGVGVPTDEQGLVILSFYHQLANARSELGDLGLDVEPVFPMGAIAYLPSLPGDSFSFENAAYSGGPAHAFILFPDLGDAVPLAANRAIVRHEFGHALFAHLTGERTAGLFDRAFNEGFADAVASLSLDMPHFLDDSLVMPSRYVDSDVAVDQDVIDAIQLDPYQLGTVFASFLWDLRTDSGDPAEVLRLTADAVQAWADAYPEYDGRGVEVEEARKTFALVDRIVEAYGTTELRRNFACDRVRARFGAWQVSAPCSL